MRILFTDLDNTLIYSYKHAIGSAKRCAEIYQGREISFLTEKSFRLLIRVQKLALIVPVTTRTVGQYARVNLGIQTPAYALACNGGVLLANGREDVSWFLESQKLIAGCREQLALGKRLMEGDRNRCFEVRDIRGLFLFTKSERPKESAEFLKEGLDGELVDVFWNGGKVYIVPKALNKGAAVRRLCDRLRPELTAAAGDSVFDVPMIRAADFGIAPEGLCGELGEGERVTYVREGTVFAEEMLEWVAAKCAVRLQPGVRTGAV